MGLFSGVNTASTGLSAQRLRMDVIANNVANVKTTRTSEGGPFRRSRVIFRPIVNDPYWKTPFLPRALDNGGGQGVQVVSIEKDYDTKTRLVYDPTHPDALQAGPQKGYVEYSNVNIITELVDMMSAERAYQANMVSVKSHMSMFESSLQL